ncbi:thioredoxin family protein [Cerasibacillus terrae]|uniref:Thioredoxin family protein n=1 Tax=Cerasibacillus terrae TaxID=2498845 RepID=A0A5C8NV75_9BACI|nr:thioredoxin family protein [Cerasibacillus terrae]TXL64940.1 thioredoxin family protein [Cerasibacillus terrae]
MIQITEEILQKDTYLLYIHSPFCGTCHVAREMLDKIESVHQTDVFYEMNASLYPDFMQTNKVESVPCLFIKKEGIVKEKIYVFRSIPNIYQYLLQYAPQLFRQDS